MGVGERPKYLTEIDIFQPRMERGEKLNQKGDGS